MINCARGEWENKLRANSGDLNSSHTFACSSGEQTKRWDILSLVRRQLRYQEGEIDQLRHEIAVAWSITRRWDSSVVTSRMPQVDRKILVFGSKAVVSTLGSEPKKNCNSVSGDLESAGESPKHKSPSVNWWKIFLSFGHVRSNFNFNLSHSCGHQYRLVATVANRRHETSFSSQLESAVYANRCR